MTEHKVAICTGDLLSSKADVLVHQCNACGTKPMGLSMQMFQTYPFSNVYAQTQSRQLGTCIIKRQDGCPVVVNMIAQRYAGKARKSGDDTTKRLHWFTRCLDNLKNLPEAQDESKVIAFPFKIGCGLAGGNWDTYNALIFTFAQKVVCQVQLWRLMPEKRPSSSRYVKSSNKSYKKIKIK